ncbi:rhamnulokinase family protein [Salinibacterium sp. ZJ70]|uniref:rhamnulokinase n=1 Tax=Salinibacterium sp. ZJ70 TaxID=2708084 RepID=UPI0014236E1B|nr:rhamnulokinase family protein [Salinibacterium sp. ZJ70]
MSVVREGVVAAVDLGATSGRVVLGRISRDGIRIEEVARFPNAPVRTPDGLHWSVSQLYRDVVEGLAEAARRAPDLVSIGIDSWAVDYALLREGRTLGEPYSYRDERNHAAVDIVHRLVSAEELYARNGLQHLPFTTLFQLTADRTAGTLALADGLLLLPDLLAFWLTGTAVAERTNASTTGLLNVSTREWDAELAERLGVPVSILSPLVEPGTVLGPLLPSALRGTGATDAVVTAVGSHDTASAVVAVPSRDRDIAYVSCGTWSLVGVECDEPVLSEAGRAAGFTNEGGVDGRVRYLHNVMGLWLLSESVRDWERSGERIDLVRLLTEAEAVTAAVPLFDADDPTFLSPGSMPDRIRAWFADRGLTPPGSRAELVRSIIESLAAAYAQTIRKASELTRVEVRAVHIVGGGSQNTLLCQRTADATGLPVIAGPVEATAIGNVLVQARAHGLVEGDLAVLRTLVADTFPLTRYAPRD